MTTPHSTPPPPAETSEPQRGATESAAVYAARLAARAAARADDPEIQRKPPEPTPATGKVLARAAATHAAMLERLAAIAPSSPSAASSPSTPAPSSKRERAPRKPRKPRLPRKEWLLAELAELELQEGCARVANDSRSEFGDGTWTGARRAHLTRRKAETRAACGMEGSVSSARATWRHWSRTPGLQVYAIAIKRMCAEYGWTLADLAARRRLAILHNQINTAVETNYNAGVARSRKRARRRTGRPEAVSTTLLRKFSPCVRGQSQRWLAGVIAWPGDTAEDSRAVHRDTVRQCVKDLIKFRALHAYRPPESAVESWEKGRERKLKDGTKRRYVMLRYWLHGTAGVFKPALAAAYEADGTLRWLDVLDAPWSAAKPRLHAIRRKPKPDATPPPAA